MSWELMYEGSAPRLPHWVVPKTPGIDVQTLRKEYLKKGCWQVLVVPDYSHDVRRDLRYGLSYRGTLRMEWGGEGENSTLRASGDLYRDLKPKKQEEPGLRDEKQIPSFPHSEYRYYCRLEGLKREPHSDWIFDLDVYRFSHQTNGWELDDKLQAKLASIPRSDQRRQLEGVLKNPGGTVVATFKMAWLSEFFRRAKVQVKRVKRVEELPGDPLRTLFRKAGWKIAVDNEKKFLQEKTGAVWQPRDLHDELRGALSDEDWTYTLLCVRRTTRERFGGFGVMFDAWPVDSDNIPREGAAVACRARFWLDDDLYGPWSGRVLEDCRAPATPDPKKGRRVAYLRAAVHELGHAMGLAHNFAGLGFMQSMGNLAERAEMEGLQLPEKAILSECNQFDEEDALCLRHLPDGWVRPGGVQFLSGFSHEPVPVEDLTEDLTKKQRLGLEITPAERILPLGAPLRLTFDLYNVSSEETIEVPKKIGLSSGHLAGSVVEDGGADRAFSTVVHPLYERNMQTLKAAGKVEQGKEDEFDHAIRSETLLRGTGGALLPGPGFYRIEAEIAWEVHEGGRKCARGGTTVLVKEPEEHSAECALNVLSCKELMLPLVFHGNWPGEAVEVLQKAVEDESLRGHFAAIEARRLLSEAERGNASLYEKAAECLTTHRSDLVVTGSEIASIAGVFLNAPNSILKKTTVRDANSLLVARKDQLVTEGLISTGEVEKVVKLNKRVIGLMPPKPKKPRGSSRKKEEVLQPIG